MKFMVECLMDRTVSVIIPVFNTEPRLLGRAVESALAQVYLKEIILIDDGSSTDVAAAIDMVAAQHPEKIRVEHKENRGVSSARNSGLDIANGEYVAFLDADDVLCPDFCWQAVSHMRESSCDVLFGAMEFVFPNGTSKILGNPEIGDAFLDFTGNQIAPIKGCIFNSHALERVGLAPAMYVSQCATLYRREAIGKHRFSTDLAISEDRVFNYEVLSDCSRISITGSTWYRYIQNPGSSSQRFRPNAREELLNTAHKIASFIPDDEDQANDLNVGIVECFQQTLGFSIVHEDFERVSGIGRREYVSRLMREPVYRHAFAVAQVTNLKQKPIQFFFNRRMPGMIVLILRGYRSLSRIRHLR